MGGQKRDGHHEAKRPKDSERIEGVKTGQGTQRLGGSDLLDRRPELTHLPYDACSCVKEIKDIAGGAVSSALPPHPKQVPPAAQVKGGGNQNIGALERTQGTQGTGMPDGYGGRRVILALLGGGRHLNENTGGEEARGGERYARAGSCSCRRLLDRKSVVYMSMNVPM